MSDAAVIHPRDKAVRGMVCGIPSFGMIHVDFAVSMAQQAMPINFGMQFMTPGHTQPLKHVRWDWEEGKIVHVSEWKKKNPGHPMFNTPWIHEVGEARNILVQYCIDNNVEYLFFRDDDTVCPPDAINKLYSDKLDIVGGYYMSKQMPPHGLILAEGYLAGYDDFRPGEIVRCNHIGMGMTLIRVEVFKKIREELGVKHWFKTVNSLEDNDIQEHAPNAGRMTEDVYFCSLARAVGYTVNCDTGVCGHHIDVKTHTRYYYHEGIRNGCWETWDGNVAYYPPGSDPQRGTTADLIEDAQSKMTEEQAAEIPQRPLMLDLGCPKATKQEGFHSVDLFEDADYRHDIRSLMPLLTAIGQADVLKVHHVLEHFGPGEIPGILRHWFTDVLLPGGVALFAVPDFDWIVDIHHEHPDFDDPQTFWTRRASLYGAQTNPGDIHKSPFTMTQLTKMLEWAGFELMEGWYEQYPDSRVQRSCVVVVRKPGEDADLSQFDIDDIKGERHDQIQAALAAYDSETPQQPIMTPFIHNGPEDAAEMEEEQEQEVAHV